MTSRALAAWRNERTARLDRLEAAHASIGETGPGARKVTDELNHALVVRIATEFQGYTRELHDEASYAIVAQLAPNDFDLQDRLRVPYQRIRRIDRGNADPEALHQDFWLFDLRFWDELRQAYPARARVWRRSLALLNEARNGLAHAEDQKVHRVAASGWPITIRSARRWRSTLDALATAMDHLVADHLRTEFGVEPW